MSVLCCVLLYDFVHCLLLRRNNKYITSPRPQRARARPPRNPGDSGPNPPPVTTRQATTPDQYSQYCFQALN